MTVRDRARIDAFLAGKRIAFVGLSTKADDFSRYVAKELAARGYEILPVHPGVDRIDGRPCVASVTALGAPIDFALVMVPPAAALEVVKDCERAGVRRVWLHRGAGQGSVSDEAVAYADAHGIEVVAGECPMMFVGESFHRAHAWANKLAGTYPGPDRARPWPLELRSALGYGVLAWALCGAVMMIGRALLGLDAGLIVHAVLAPAIFGALAFVYARTNGRLGPWPMALVLAATALALDAAIVAPLLERSFAMFSSAIGTWIPIGSGLLVAGGAGSAARAPALPARAAR